MIPRGDEFRSGEEKRVGQIVLIGRKRGPRATRSVHISSFDVDQKQRRIERVITVHLIPVCTKKEPNSTLVPTEAFIKGRVTAWSLAGMSIPLAITHVLIRVLC